MSVGRGCDDTRICLPVAWEDLMSLMAAELVFAMVGLVGRRGRRLWACDVGRGGATTAALGG